MNDSDDQLILKALLSLTLTRIGVPVRDHPT